MPYFVAILVVIALALIGGPVVGGLAIFAALLFLIPGLGTFLGLALLVISLLVLFRVQSIYWLVGIFIFLVSVGLFANSYKEREKVKQKEEGLLERKLIEGTDIYEDKNGQKWRKVSGIFKMV
jgi:energy-coupling factor transporter transmembrane protein EcfT